MKKRFLSILLALVMVIGMLPTTAFAASACPHSYVDWHKSSSGDEEHFKICTNPDCDDRNGSTTETSFHSDANADSLCDECSAELISVTFDYEDPAKADRIVLFAKGTRTVEAKYFGDYDEKDGYVAGNWTLSSEKTPESSISENDQGQSIMIGDAVFYTEKWDKLYEEIRFNLTGYELGGNISDCVLTDNIDEYEPDAYAIISNPTDRLVPMTGTFKANTAYWLMVRIGSAESGAQSNSCVIRVDGIDDYFLDSPECVDKYGYLSREESSEYAFFKLKPLEDPTVSDNQTTPGDSSKPGLGKDANKVPQTGDASNMMNWFVLMALTATTGTVVYKRKRF